MKISKDIDDMYKAILNIRQLPEDKRMISTIKALRARFDMGLKHAHSVALLLRKFDII